MRTIPTADHVARRVAEFTEALERGDHEHVDHLIDVAKAERNKRLARQFADMLAAHQTTETLERAA